MATLENVSVEDLRQILAEVDDADATKRLMAAITYKEMDELTQAEAAALYGFSSSWASKWFNRLERLAGEPFKSVVYDKPREGRPSELSEEEHDQFVESLHKSPQEVGYDAPAWSVPLARHYLSEEFDVEYCEHHVRRLMSEAGLSWKTARPEYYKSDERAQEAWQEGFKKARQPGRQIHDSDHRSNATGTFDADLCVVSRMGAPVTAGDGRVGYSIKLLGAVSDSGDTFFLPCAENFNSDTTIRWLDALQTEFGEKICVVLDNASYFTANAVQEFVADTPIELCYLPWGSPKRNHAEECWRRLDQALGNRLFDTLDELCEAALTALDDIELPNILRTYVLEY